MSGTTDDPFGPAQSTVNSVTTRPTDSRTFGAVDTFSKDCSSPAAQDGTPWTAEQLNEIVANLRALLRGNGTLIAGGQVVTEDHSDAMLLLAVQRLIQRGQPNYSLDTGAANALVAAPAPALLEYTAGQKISVKLANAITGAATINVSGLGTRSIVHPDGSATTAGDGAAGAIVDLVDNGTAYQLKGGQGRRIGVQAFATSGTYTPTPGMATCTASLWGAGGGSGGTAAYVSGSSLSASSAGAAGSFLEVSLTAAQIGASQAVTIGAGGAAASAGVHAGGAGGATSLGSLVSVPGGGGSPGCAASPASTVVGNAASGGLPTVSAGTVLRRSEGQPSSSVLIINSGLYAGSYFPVAIDGDEHGVPGQGQQGSPSTGLPGLAGQPGYVLIEEYS